MTAVEKKSYKIISSLLFQGLHTKTEGAKPKVFKDGQYSDPMYKKLSKINGEINKLTKQELQARLREYGLDTRYRVSQMLRVVHVAYSELPNYCFALKLLFYIIYIYILSCLKFGLAF